MSDTGLIGRLTRRDEHGERGAIIFIAAASLTLLIFAAALAIDIGGRAQEHIKDQKIADLAALDAVRVLPTAPTTEATSSADRNGYAALNSGTLLATPGTWSNGVFTPTAAASANAVKVTITSVYHDFFGGGSPTLTATAIAQNVGKAQFSIGSTLISISAFNSLLGPFGAALSLSAVGYNGLAGTNVTLGALATQLGLQALSPTQLLSSQVTMSQLFSAAANLVNSSGGSSGNLTALGAQIASGTANSNDTVTLGSILGTQSVASGNGSALSTSVNLLSVLSGGLELANNEAGVSLPLTISVPGVASASADITAIVPAKMSGFGAPGDASVTNVQDNQVTVAFTIQTTVTVAGVGLVSVTLPLTAILGNAAGTLTHILGCGTTPTGIQITTTFGNVNVAIGSGSAISAALLGSSSLTGTITVPSKTDTDRSLSYTTNFTPGGGNRVTVNSNLGSAPTVSLTLNPSNALLQPAVGAVDTAVGTIVATALPALATAASSLLGVTVGNADLLGGLAAPTCASPRLVQ